MREGNFSFTSQGRASVCITAQLYDRRALDATSALPLNNSLTHLTYLTSTSPRIREILTIDGGLESLVRMLLDFCTRPPPPLDPRHFYGLIPPGQNLDRSGVVAGKSVAGPNGGAARWAPFDRAAAHRFSLAFQCVVNVGVRGSETIRARVVQAGMLRVVGSVLEQWLLSKGFAVVPSSTGSGAPRESRQVRHQRRLEELERRTREAADARRIAEAMRTATERSLNIGSSEGEETEEGGAGGNTTGADDEEEMMAVDSSSTPSLSHPSFAHHRHHHHSHHHHSASTQRPQVSTDSSNDSIPTRPSSSASDLASGQSSSASTPVRSSTPTTVEAPRERSGTIRASSTPHASSSRGAGPSTRRASTSHRRPRSSGAGETDMDDTEGDEVEERQPASASTATATPTTLLPSTSQTQDVTVVGDAGIDIFDSGGGVGGFGEMNGGVDRAMVNLEENEGLAMGAPPGAPGATTTAAPTNLPPGATAVTPRAGGIVAEVTPRPPVPTMPDVVDPSGVGFANLTALNGVEGARVILQNLGAGGAAGVLGNLNMAMQPNQPATGNGAGDAIVRTIMAQSPELRHLPTPGRSTLSTSAGAGASQQGPFQDEDVLLSLQLLAYLSKYPYVRQAFYQARSSSPTGSTSTPSSSSEFPTSATDLNTPSSESDDPVSANSSTNTDSNNRSPNIFSLVERFTFRPSPSEPHLPRLPTEIQYWAGVIMRNACRKDESRGGIRQCANMTCGKWEKYPREFAKCRRCRKAKYCGKDCQSRAWAEGHRFWCNVKEPEDDAAVASAAAAVAGASGQAQNATAPGTVRATDGLLQPTPAPARPRTLGAGQTAPNTNPSLIVQRPVPHPHPRHQNQPRAQPQTNDSPHPPSPDPEYSGGTEAGPSRPSAPVASSRSMPLGLEAGAGGVLSATIFQQHQQQHNQNQSANATYRYSGPVASGSGGPAGVHAGPSRGHSRPLPAPVVPTLGPGQGPVPTARRASAGLASLATNIVSAPTANAQLPAARSMGRVWPPVELDDMELRMGYASPAMVEFSAQQARMLHRNMFTSDPGVATSPTTTATVQQPGTSTTPTSATRPTINVNVHASSADGQSSNSSPMTARPMSSGGSRASGSGARTSSPMRRGALEGRGEEDIHMTSP